MFIRIAIAAFVAVGLMAAAPAQATWPDHPVKVVVPQPGGSSTDIIARAFTEALAKKFGQPFVIDNKPGANGIIASDFAARAPADGYTLLFTYAAAQVVNQALYKNVRYDGARDFTAIAQVGAAGNLLVVPQSLPVKDLQEFIAYVKSKPANSLSYGSWGNGSGGHLSMEMVKQKAGIEIQHVPYKSVIASLQDMMAGQIQCAFASLASALPLIKGGQIKAIGYSAPKRLSLLPEVGTLSEQGVAFDLTAWYGFFAPKGAPPEVVAALNTEINRLILAPDMQAQWTILGLTDMPTKSPAEFSQQVERDVKDWGEIVRSANIKAE